MRKGRNGEKKMENGNKVIIIIMTFIVATNFVANRPHECRPTGRATARANLELSSSSGKQIVYEVLSRYSFIHTLYF